MKKKAFLPLLFFLNLFSNFAFAQETESIALRLNSQFLSRLCSTPIFKADEVNWKGVKDNRLNKEIGIETLRNKNPIFFISNPSLEVVFNETFKTVFNKCGIDFTDHKENLIEMRAEIEEFYANTNRKLITAKGSAKSKILFFIIRPSRKQKIEIGYELESKKTREKSLSQTEQLLNELFEKTIEQIPITKQFQEIE